MVPKEFLITDFDFSRQFRMSRIQFERLMRRIGRFFPPGESRNLVSVKPRERILHFLHYLGANALYKDAQVRMKKQFEKCYT